MHMAWPNYLSQAGQQKCRIPVPRELRKGLRQAISATRRAGFSQTHECLAEAMRKLELVAGTGMPMQLPKRCEWLETQVAATRATFERELASAAIDAGTVAGPTRTKDSEQPDGPTGQAMPQTRQATETALVDQTETAGQAAEKDKLWHRLVVWRPLVAAMIAWGTMEWVTTVTKPPEPTGPIWTFIFVAFCWAASRIYYQDKFWHLTHTDKQDCRRKDLWRNAGQIEHLGKIVDNALNQLAGYAAKVMQTVAAAGNTGDSREHGQCSQQSDFAKD